MAAFIGKAAGRKVVLLHSREACFKNKILGKWAVFQRNT